MSEKSTSLISRFNCREYNYLARLFSNNEPDWKAINNAEKQRDESREELENYIEQIEAQINELKEIINCAKEPLEEELATWTAMQVIDLPFLRRIKKALSILESIEEHQDE